MLEFLGLIVYLQDVRIGAGINERKMQANERTSAEMFL